MLYGEVIERFVAVTKDILGEELTGIYLHGSLAMGCFNPEKSDIDLIVIVENNISDIQKMTFLEQIVALNSKAPEKGLEVSIVKRKYCRPFIYPTPFELHFSPMHLQWFYEDPESYVAHMKGEDKDLAAHFMIIRQYGITLYGEEIENVFAEVPREAYIDSIWEDVKGAEEDIKAEPIDVILNLCRALAYLQNGVCLSKLEGGKWGLSHLHDEFSPVIAEAMGCYQTGREMNMEEGQLRAFAERMLMLIKGGIV